VGAVTVTAVVFFADVVVVLKITGPGPTGRVVVLPVVAGAVAVVVTVIDDNAALYSAHRAWPMDWMAGISVAEQEAMMQGAARAPMEACVGPHWQPWSDGAQPALEMAEEMQAVAQAGSAERFCAVESVRRVVRVRSWSFMVVVVVVVVVVIGRSGVYGVICCLFDGKEEFDEVVSIDVQLR
jgi:hypothetical protein